MVGGLLDGRSRHQRTRRHFRIYSDGVRLHGVLLRDRIFETIDFPGSVNDGGTLVMDDNGFLVGGFIDAKGSEHGFIAR